jgi:hypothetical protein
MTSSVLTASSAPLRRFVTDGIRATLDAYRAGTLPLHRLTWELQTRLTTLGELTALPHYRTLATLRAAQHTVATIDTALRHTGRDTLTAAEHHALATALTTLRTGLARLDPPDPTDPVEVTGTRPVVVAFPVRSAADPAITHHTITHHTAARQAATAGHSDGHTAA